MRKACQNLLKFLRIEKFDFLQQDKTEEFKIVDGKIIEIEKVQDKIGESEEFQYQEEKKESVEKEKEIKKKTGRPLQLETVKKEFFENIFGRLLPSTIRQYKLDFCNFEKFLSEKNKKIHQLTALDIEDYISWQKHRNCGEQIIRRRLSFLGTFSKFLRKKGLDWIKVDIVDKPKLRKKVARCIEPLIFERLLPQIKAGVMNGEREAKWVAMMAVCGMRISEVTKAKLNGTKWLVKGKGGKERLVPCPSWLRTELRGYEKKKPNCIRMRTKEWLGQFGIQINPHGLRHTYATYLLYRGVKLESVRQILGHEDIKTTQAYLHVEETECLDFLEL